MLLLCYIDVVIRCRFGQRTSCAGGEEVREKEVVEEEEVRDKEVGGEKEVGRRGNFRADGAGRE